MKQHLKEQLEKTLFVHYPLKADESKSLEARLIKKEILSEIALWDGEKEDCWSFRGKGETSFTGSILKMTTNIRENYWPETESQDGDYATYGDYTAFLDVTEKDLGSYNQIYFEVKPDCDGLHSPMVRVGFENDGIHKIPDAYTREGFNAISLENHKWNSCIWTITEVPHDKMTKILFRIHKYGKEVSTSDTMKFKFRNIRMQQVKLPQVTKGWLCEEDSVVFSTSGYWCNGRKTAIANTKETTFRLIDVEMNRQVLEGPVEIIKNDKGAFGVLDFSSVTVPGTYAIQLGGEKTEAFPIGEKILEDAVWKVINFLFCERCGFPVPDKHGTCHQDVYVDHNGLRMVYSGGWHDAADVSQQTVQTAEVAHGLMEAAQTAKDDRMLYLRLMEEANWGMDFVLRSRFGDGYRATSAGLRRWTDNLIGNFDDVSGRCHNNPFDNFIMAGVEAMAAKAFKEMDMDLSWKCLDAAKEDFLFAKEVFDKVGILRPEYHEHTLNASTSQHYAVASWAASCICSLTEEEYFKEEAVSYMDKLLACQDEGETGLFIKGFFYRDETKKTIVHFSHQSREHVFAQALTEIAIVLPNHPKVSVWKTAMESYGEYLKKLMQYTAPYGMIPSGVYCIDEIDDVENFLLVHPRLKFQNERANYIEQLEKGIRLNDRYFIKCFPVWFSFRGNTAIILSMGKAASLIGKYLEDRELIEIAREQIYWIAGKNPFGNSFIYGEGSSYGKQYTALAGDMVGEMPVGIQTQGNEDLPYWPMANIACYREIWTTSAGHWLWLAADLYHGN